MKKSLSFSIAMFVLASFAVGACSTNEHADMGATSVANNDSGDQLCDQVGADHNLIMDQMFDEIFRQMPSSRSNVTDPFLPIDPIRPPDIPVKPIRFEYDMLKTIDLLSISESKKLEMKRHWTKVCDSIRLGLIDTTFVFNPSASYNIYEAQIVDVFENDDFDMASLNVCLDNIKENVKRVDDDIERRILLMALSVTKNTLQYWHDNYDRICDSLNSIAPPVLNPLSQSDSHCRQVSTRGWLGYNWKKAGKTDANAAFLAGIWYCGSGLAAGGPLSWQAGAAYVAGRAAFASLFDLAGQYLVGSGYSLELVGDLVDETYEMNYNALLTDLLQAPYIDKPIIILATPNS